MKLSDFIAEFLFQKGITHVFGVTGGAVAHLFDSVSRHPQMTPVFHHHEQAAAFAAQSFARIRNQPGCAFVTTGPGGTNAITGVTAAWQDSIPCLYISGQTRLAHTSNGKKIRQYGSQELDITTLVSPVVKKAFLVKEATSIQEVMEEAYYLATTGRPGPVWIDIPLDVQWAIVNPSELPHFHTPTPIPTPSAEQIYELLSEAKRPLALIGHGTRLAHAEDLAYKWLSNLQIPYVTTWNASDMFSSQDPLNIGRPGLFGQRGANMAMQNADLLLVFGSHLCTSITGTLFNAFAREAKIVMVNIDAEELSHRTVPVHLPILGDVRAIIEKLLATMPNVPCHYSTWVQKCASYKKAFNSIKKDPSYYGINASENRVNPYLFLDDLSDHLSSDTTIVVDGGGTTVQIAFQTLRLKKNQRLLIDAGTCAMGSGLPQAIGAAFAKQSPVICLYGDGSLQFNIHELQTIFHHNLPIKIFVFNNDGYLSIRHTQKAFLEGLYAGSSKKGGISLPDTSKLAAAYNIPFQRFSSSEQVTSSSIQNILNQPGPFLCEILSPSELSVAPKQGFLCNNNGTYSPAPLEEMHPPLSLEQFLDAMCISQWEKR